MSIEDVWGELKKNQSIRSHLKAKKTKPKAERSVPYTKPQPIVRLPTATVFKTYRGARDFRARIVCATLSGQPIKIEAIRANEDSPGLRDYEISFLRLLDKVSNGCAIQINETGTIVRYRPGFVTGSAASLAVGTTLIEAIEHECPTSVSIGYFLEWLLCLAPFAKRQLHVVFKGVTNHASNTHCSVDICRAVAVPLLQKFGVGAESAGSFEIKVRKRGFANGGGEVVFKCPIVNSLKPVSMVDEGKIQKVRGSACTAKCSSQIGTRMVDGARKVLNNLLPDVYIWSDHNKGKDSGNSSGFALSLAAQSTSGSVLSAEWCAVENQAPEDVGRLVAHQLLEQVTLGGVVDSSLQATALLFMCLCPEDVSRLRLGPLTPYTIQCLRLYRDFFGVTFKIKPDTSNKTVLMSCLGSGFKNFARKST